jgi:hypothetical protein
MKAQAIQEENLTVPVPERQEKAEKTVASEISYDETAGDAAPSDMPGTPNPEPEIEPDDTIRILLDQIEVDGSIFPRASLDKYTVKQYAAALIRGEQLPPITIEAIGQEKYRVLKGVHRFEAYYLRRDLYTGKLVGDFYDDPLLPISDSEFNSISCFIGTLPPDIHPMVFAMEDNLKHGKPLTSEDYKKIARQVYQDNPGAPVKELAKLIKVSRKVFKAYVSDLVEDFEKEKDNLIGELHAQGASEAKISQELKEKFPKAKGLSQSQISKVLLEKDDAEKRDENEDNPDVKGTGSSQEGTPEEGLAGDDPEADEATESSEATETPEATTKTVELQVVCGNQSDTIMILGLHSLPPHLQERLKTEVEEVVKQIRAEKLAIQEQEDQAEKSGSENQDEPPDTPEIAEYANQSIDTKSTVQKIQPAIQPTRGSRPLN